MGAMRNSSRTIGCVVVVAAAIWALWTAPVASADCSAPPPLKEALAAAQIAFVGTVTGLKNDGRTATFRIEEVWKGSVLGETVIVNGGPPGVGTSVDRTYEIGVRYLVVPLRASGDVFQDNSCSSTQPFTSKLDRFRPTSASPPIFGPKPAPAAGLPDESNGGWSWSVIVLIAAALAAVGTAAWLVAKSRRTTSAH
jgi:hypothetical protein